MKYDSTRADLDFLNPHEMDGEIEKSKNELFWECEDNTSEAINYVHELETQIREAKELLKVYIDECGQMTNGIVKSRFSKILKVLK
jgi:hypothetical protein